MKQCNVWDAGQRVYIFISLLVKLKPSDNFKKADGQRSQSSNQYHERNVLDKEERECCPTIEIEVSRDLLVHVRHKATIPPMVWGIWRHPLPRTAAISEEHTGGFFAPRTLKGHVQSGFF